MSENNFYQANEVVEQPSYYTNIPASVRYDKVLPPMAKLLYGELTCLVNKYGYCFARNKYFAELYEMSEDRISRLLHLLEQKGYIEIEIFRNECNFIVNRRIKIIDRCLSPSCKNNDSHTVKKQDAVVENDRTNINTYNNNTNNINTSSSAPASEIELLKKQIEEQKAKLDDQAKIISELQYFSDKRSTEASASEKKETQKKTSFPKDEYNNCIKMIKDNQASLRNNGKRIDETEYPYQMIMKWLKQNFLTYGVESTKKGIQNSINHSWLVNEAHYSLTALFKDTVFVKCVSGEFFNTPPKTVPKTSGYAQICNNLNYASTF